MRRPPVEINREGKEGNQLLVSSQFRGVLSGDPQLLHVCARQGVFFSHV